MKSDNVKNNKCLAFKSERIQRNVERGPARLLCGGLNFFSFVGVGIDDRTTC